jgi:hypothetical protein
MAAFWGMAPCSLVEGDRRFRGACCLQMIAAVQTSETSVSFYDTTQRNIPEGRRENLKSHIFYWQVLIIFNMCLLP